MIKKHRLGLREKKLSKIIYLLLIFIGLILMKGMFNDAMNIDENKILLPSCLILCSIFCIIYSHNAFTAGNLVRNWSSRLIFEKIYNHISKNSSLSEENLIKKTTFYFGYFSLILALICIISLCISLF